MVHHKRHQQGKKDKEFEISSLLKGRKIASDCASSGYPRVIHTAEKWALLQSAYKKVVDRASVRRRLLEAFHDRRRLLGMDRHGDEEAPGSTNHLYDSGLKIDFEVKEGQRGRGVFVAKNAVPKGKKVWGIGSEYSYTSFRRPEDMIDFLEMLPHDLQCDVMLWAYPTGKTAHVDLNEGSFINHADEPDLVNLDSHCRALREIAAGEELLMDYSEFIDKLEWFDDLRAYTWNNNESTGAGDDIVYYTKVGAPRTSSVMDGGGGGDGITLETAISSMGLYGNKDGHALVVVSLQVVSMLALLLIASVRGVRRFFIAKGQRHTI